MKIFGTKLVILDEDKKKTNKKEMIRVKRRRFVLTIETI